MVPETGAAAPVRGLRLGRLVQQQGADLGPGRADLQPAFGLGGGGARRAESRRAVLAFSVAQRTKGSLRPGATVILGRLEILAEQIGGEEPVDVSVAEELSRTA